MKITKLNFLIKFTLFSLFTLFFSIFLVSTSFADSLFGQQVGMSTDEVGSAFGSGGISEDEIKDPRIVIADAIGVFLGFMGVVFLVLIVYAGLLWMTAAGKEDQVGKAKSLLVAAVIGLIIVVASFAITRLITTKIFDTTITTSALNQVA